MIEHRLCVGFADFRVVLFNPFKGTFGKKRVKNIVDWIYLLNAVKGQIKKITQMLFSLCAHF